MDNCFKRSECYHIHWYSPKTHCWIKKRRREHKIAHRINVGDNPLQKTLKPPDFQLEIIVSTVMPIPWLLGALADVEPCILVLTTSSGNVVNQLVTPARAPARRRAGHGTVRKSESIVSIKSEEECGYDRSCEGTGFEKNLQVASYCSTISSHNCYVGDLLTVKK
jgi:hypothetical protein